VIRPDDVPSRVVENLFWLGRYTVRCADHARLLRSTVRVRIDRAVWRHAVRICRALGVLSSDSQPPVPFTAEDDPFGIAADVKRIAWCASQVRSRLSAEHWRAISVMQRHFAEAGATQADPLETLDRLLVSLTALSGFALDDMTQDDGWRLLMLGRRLERVQCLTGLLSARLAASEHTSQHELEWLLEVGGASVTYRTRYMAAPQLHEVLQVMLFDEASPRAAAYQWAAARASLADLSASLGTPPDDQLESPIEQLCALDLFGIGEDSAHARALRARMSAALSRVSAAAGQLSDRLALRHFSLVDLDVQTLAS